VSSDPTGTLVTIDVEDHGPIDRPPRFRQALEPLLGLLQSRGLVATFFVVGALAPSWKDDLRQLAADGHVIGLHGYTHRFLRDLGPEEFRRELRRGCETLAAITGERPWGFRAPYFSLTRDTPWAPDILGEEGFIYSSSVLPAWNPQAGLPGMPKTPFRWSSGVVEFPVPVFGIGRFGVPVLGGAYLRLMPSAVVRAAERRSRGIGRWTYAHPYDFDVDESFFRRTGQSWLVAKLLFARRHLMLPRVMQLVGDVGPTFDALSQDADFVGNLPTIGGVTTRL
jgi:peptidoglycan/xylan/chitin deacetylase (PgdA/CDA1 family)